MNKKDLLDNIRDYSPKEIANAIKSGMVTLYELKSGTHGQFTPMLQRQVQQKLAEEDKPEEPVQPTEPTVVEDIFVPGEPTEPAHVAEPEPFKPAKSEPFRPAEPRPAPEPETAWQPEPEPERVIQDPKPAYTSPEQEPQPSQSRMISCPECGRMVSPRATECPSCGMPLSGESPTGFAPAYETVQQVQQEPVYAPAFEQVQQTQRQVSTPTETPNCINKFNWGALIFGWLWGICNGVNWALITILLGGLAELFQNYSADPFLETGLPLILSLSTLAINIFLGIRGNKLAWKSKKFASAEAFDRAQAKWRNAAFIVLGIIAGIVILTIVL